MISNPKTSVTTFGFTVRDNFQSLSKFCDAMREYFDSID